MLGGRCPFRVVMVLYRVVNKLVGIHLVPDQEQLRTPVEHMYSQRTQANGRYDIFLIPCVCIAGTGCGPKQNTWSGNQMSR